MTATLTKPAPAKRAEETHTMILGSTRFYCIERDCDRVHHVWCSCAH